MMAARISVAEVKAEVVLSELVGRDVEWDRRRSRPGIGVRWACCPFHVERTPSFKVDDRRGTYHCFGCGAGGSAIDYVMALDGLDFPSALARLAALAGISAEPEGGPARSPGERRDAFSDGARACAAGGASTMNPHRRGDPLRAAWRDGWAARDRQEQAREALLDARRGLAKAAAIWRASRPDHPVLRAYLAARGVDVGVMARIWRHGVPPTIRCHPALPYWVEERNAHGQFRRREAHRGPAMIGLIAAPGFVLGHHAGEAGIHRTWVEAAGRARLPGLGKLDKRMLGATGHIEPVPIRITAHTRRMIVGEGIETVLALWSRLADGWLAGSRGFWSAEVAKSRGAIAGGDLAASRAARPGGGWLTGTEPDPARPGWLAPDHVDDLVILAEGSARDPADAERTYARAVRRHRWRRDGGARACRLALPGGRWDRGLDFADLAAAEAAAGMSE